MDCLLVVYFPSRCFQRDCSPYSLSYLSPPPDTSWRRSVHEYSVCTVSQYTFL